MGTYEKNDMMYAIHYSVTGLLLKEICSDGARGMRKVGDLLEREGLPAPPFPLYFSVATQGISVKRMCTRVRRSALQTFLTNAGYMNIVEGGDFSIEFAAAHDGLFTPSGIVVQGERMFAHLEEIVAQANALCVYTFVLHVESEACLQQALAAIIRFPLCAFMLYLPGEAAPQYGEAFAVYDNAMTVLAPLSPQASAALEARLPAFDTKGGMFAFAADAPPQEKQTRLLWDAGIHTLFLLEPADTEPLDGSMITLDWERDVLMREQEQGRVPLVLDDDFRVAAHPIAAYMEVLARV